jgi:hypothetical protein
LGKKERHFAPLIKTFFEDLVPADPFYRHLEHALDLSFVWEFVQRITLRFHHVQGAKLRVSQSAPQARSPAIGIALPDLHLFGYNRRVRISGVTQENHRQREGNVCPIKTGNKQLLYHILLQKMLRPGKRIGKHKANRGVLCLKLTQSVKKSLLNVVRLSLISKRVSILSRG